MIFLDTHVAVWLYQGRTDLLSKRAEKIIGLLNSPFPNQLLFPNYK